VMTIFAFIRASRMLRKNPPPGEHFLIPAQRR